MIFRNTSRGKKITLMVIFGIIFVVALSFLVMFLWNITISQIFSLQEITFWQALGLLVLSKILFGGFRPGRRGRPSWRHTHWRNKWMNMSDEEREHFRKMWKERCGKMGKEDFFDPKSESSEKKENES